MRGRILAGLTLGLLPEVAAENAGISRRTFFNWKKRGEAGEAPYEEFLDACNRALAQCQRELVSVIIECARDRKDPKRWLPAAWLMERRFGYVARKPEEKSEGGDPPKFIVQLAMPERPKSDDGE